MDQQYAITVFWNDRLRNVGFDAQGLAVAAQLLDGALPTEANRYQICCILSVLSGPNQGLYSNSGTVAVPTWQNIVVSPVIRVSRIVTLAEIKQLFTTPIEIAPAPGVGFYVVPQQCFLKYSAAINYVQPGNTNIVMGATSNNIFQFGQFLINPSTTRFYFPNNSAQIFENTSLRFFNTIGNPSVGTGEFEIVLYYQIASSSL